MPNGIFDLCVNCQNYIELHHTLFTLRNNFSLETLVDCWRQSKLIFYFCILEFQSRIEYLVEFNFENAKVKIKWITLAY